MKITAVDAIPLRAELSQPFRFATITRTTSANVIVRVETDTGLIGWGEACPVPQLTAETQAGIVELIETRMRTVLLGENPLHRTRLFANLQAISHGVQFTLAALDTAFLDLAAKHAGIGIAELLGGRTADRVAVHGSVGWDADPDAVADTAERSARDFEWLKLYAGNGALHDDLSSIERARERVGAEHPFLLDINGMWSVADVARAAPRLREAGVGLIEQPVSPTDTHGRVACQILVEHGIDVAADEAVRSPSDVVRVADSGAASVINIGVSKLGGITPALATARVAEAFGLGVMVGGVVELGVANAAGIHLAACLPDTVVPSYLMGPLKYRHQITRPVIAPSDSTLDVPTAPGLGVDVDEDALAELDTRAS